MRMPSCDAKHVLIRSKAFDVRRFKPCAGQHEFRLVVESRDRDKCLVKTQYAFNLLASRTTSLTFRRNDSCGGGETGTCESSAVTRMIGRSRPSNAASV